MSDTLNLLNGIKSQIQAGLPEVKNFYVDEDALDLINSGKTPCINVDVRDSVKITEIPPYNLKQAEQRIYPIRVYFAVKKKSNSEAINYVWYIVDKTKDIIEEDVSFGGVATESITQMNLKYEIPNAVSQEKGTTNYIGEAALLFDVYIHKMKI